MRLSYLVTNMKAKMIQLKKISAFNFKVINTNSYKLKTLTRLNYTSWGSNCDLSLSGIHGAQQQKDKPRQKRKIHLIFAR